ncbi:MAG: hypothetical protein ACE5K0_05385 [Candidatus Methanofastidiosia archaeon]
MKALIIADSKDDEPKPLIKLLDLSLIERVIVIGYLGEKIKAKLGNGNRYGVKIDYIENREWENDLYFL